MIEILLEPFEGDDPNSSAAYPNAIPYSDVQVALSPINENCSYWVENVLKAIDSYQQPSSGDAEAPNKKRDLFITLPDPVGCLYDITMGTLWEFAQFRANIEAMRTGRDPDTLVYKMFNLQEQDPYTPKELEHIDMFTLAQMSYHLVFNENDMSREYGSEYEAEGTLATVYDFWFTDRSILKKSLELLMTEMELVRKN